MKFWLLGLSLSAASCLPAYDNMYHPTSADGGSDGPPPACVGSGVKVIASPFALEDEANGPGPIVAVDGCPQLASLPAGSNGQVSFELPKSINDAKTPYYLITTGTWKSAAVLQSIFAPTRFIDPAVTTEQLHFFQTADMTGIRGNVIASLVQQSVLTAAEGSSFDSQFVFAYGNLSLRTDQGLTFYGKYSVQVDSLSNTSCKPSMQCCVYYAQNYSAWKASNAKLGTTTNFVDITATQASFSVFPQPSYFDFAVVCPATGTKPEVMLTQTASGVADQMGGAAPKPFPPISIPLRAGFGTYVEWQITQ